ncbi:potassium channel family protein [Frankia sp. AiPa1]|uniref:potassium channel family protein n=1 Tax=Frankia sp. AiPa1 TaxID=573492 RepID=UPI00202B8D69|nr:potassium channel family protein [Frankia sp. AiPa1]MCL9758154.1 potassium channel family protein [Frankia sp. AiPa1]
MSCNPSGERSQPADPATRRRLIWHAVRRAGVNITVLVLLYYLLPLRGALDPAAILLLVAGLLAFTVLAGWQLRSILRSQYPAIRAIEALALSIPLFLILFASTYFLMSRADAGTFTEPMSRTDALYFTVAVFATVGFGDIAPKSESARIVTMVQMLADLLVLGLLIRAVFSAVEHGKRRRTTPPASPASAETRRR